MRSSSVSFLARTVCRRLAPLGLAAACVWLACHVPLSADDLTDSDPNRTAPATSGADDVWVLDPSTSGSVSGGPRPAAKPQAPLPDVGGFGVNARLGHLAGQQVGRRESMTFVEFAPFTTLDEIFIGGDFRLLRPNTGNDLVASGGVILRKFFDGPNAILGGNFYFDSDGSRGKTFQQVGFGVEWLSTWLDIRTNAYFPTGDTTKEVKNGIVAGSETFVTNYLYYDRFSQQATAAKGVDMMFTVPVPGQWAQAINLEATAGWYYYNPDDSRIKDFAGAKLRVDGSIVSRLLHMYVEYSNDRVFDSNVSMGVDINYWNRYTNGPRLGGNQFYRITDYVRRNWTVVAVDQTAVDAGILAADRAGNPYFFEHVDTVNGNQLGDGTFENPYSTIQLAQTNGPGGADSIIYVHAGSVFNTPLVMQDDERILGEGVTHLLPVEGGGSVMLPGTGKPGGLPTFEGITGPAVTLANRVTFAGFNIAEITGGPAVLGDGIRNANLYGLRISDVNNGDGIVLRNSHGLITLNDVNFLLANPADDFTGVDGNSFFVDGGDARIVYTNSLIQNSIGRSVRIQNAAGSVDMRSTIIDSFNNAGGNNFGADDGIIVTDSSTDVQFGRLNLVNGPIDLLNITGDITFTQPVTIFRAVGNPENPTGIPFHVDGSTGLISFLSSAPLEIVDHFATAMDLRNISGTIRFDADITVRGNTINNFPDLFTPALVWQQNSGSFISNGNFTAADLANNYANQSQGIIIGDRTGALSNLAGSSFRMNGQFLISGTYDTDGVTGTANSAIEILNDPTNVFFSGGIIQNRNPTPPPVTTALPLAPTGGIEILNTTGTIQFANTTQIFNSDTNTDSNFAPLLVNGAQGDLTFGTLTIFEGRDSATPSHSAVQIDNSGNVHFDELNVQYVGVSGNTDTTAAVDIRNSGRITAGGGTITASDARAINLIDNESIDWTSTSISATNDQFGIFVSNSPGAFTVTGVGNVAGSGGVISMAFQNPTGPNVEVGAAFLGTDQNDETNIVNLRNMVFDDNDTAIIVQNYNQFILDSSQVSNTGLDANFLQTDAVALTDVANVWVKDSVFLDNDFTHFRADITTDSGETYDYIFERNRFTDVRFFGGASMVEINNLGAVGADMNLIVRDHGGRLSGYTGFTSGRSDPSLTDPVFSSDSAAFDVRWNGQLTALVENNSFLLLGTTGAKGVEIINASQTAATAVVYRNNILQNTASASNTAGLFVDIAGAASVQAYDNFRREVNGSITSGMTLNGLNDRAYVITLRSGTNQVLLEDNRIDFNNDNGVAFNFPFVGGSTAYRINGNVVNFNTNAVASGPGERGFVWGAVTGTQGFTGNVNNQVIFASPDSFSRAIFPTTISGSLGTFRLNNQQVPAAP